MNTQPVVDFLAKRQAIVVAAFVLLTLAVTDLATGLVEAAGDATAAFLKAMGIVVGIALAAAFFGWLVARTLNSFSTKPAQPVQTATVADEPEAVSEISEHANVETWPAIHQATLLGTDHAAYATIITPRQDDEDVNIIANGHGPRSLLARLRRAWILLRYNHEEVVVRVNRHDYDQAVIQLARLNLKDRNVGVQPRRRTFTA